MKDEKKCRGCGEKLSDHVVIPVLVRVDAPREGGRRAPAGDLARYERGWDRIFGASIQPDPSLPVS